MKHACLCQLPVAMSVTGRSSSITNAFFNAIIPVIEPSEDEVKEAFLILQIDPKDIRCAYCGDKYTEWDHLRAIIRDKKPTGYITEISNLVPSCGKCNQSKGNTDWHTWMESGAKLSPKSRGIQHLAERIERLQKYAEWREPHKINFDEVIDPEKWRQHNENWRQVLELLKKSQELANELRDVVAKSLREKVLLA